MSKIKELIEKEVLIILKNFAKDNNLNSGMKAHIWFTEWLREHPIEDLSQPTINEGYDLKTLEHIKLIFDIHSDMSSSTNGYRSLCDLIDKIKSNLQLSQPKGMTKSKVGREKK